MSEQQRIDRVARARQDVRDGDAEQAAVLLPQVGAQDSGLDDLLDEIDQVLETDAADYVRSFVQKGGQ